MREDKEFIKRLGYVPTLEEVERALDAESRAGRGVYESSD